MTVVRWQDWEGHGLEHCSCRVDSNGMVLEGVVAGKSHRTFGARYLVRTDAAFRTREVVVQYVGGPCLRLDADGEGNWRDVVRNRSVPALNGCVDVDIGVTPATNALPIRRLNLEAQEARVIAAAYIPLPDQTDGDVLPKKSEQRYTCVVPGQRYVYEGLSSAFSAELEIDEAGLVLDYPGTFRRVHVAD